MEFENFEDIIFFQNACRLYLQRIRKLARPDPLWGPYLVRHRRLVTYVEDFDLDPRGLEGPSTIHDKKPEVRFCDRTKTNCKVI